MYNLFVNKKVFMKYLIFLLKPLSNPKCKNLVLLLLCRRQHPTPVLLPGKSHGQRSLVGYGPWGREESDTTEQLPFHFSLSCTGEGNGNPLQCSCLENPRDGEPGGLPSMGSHRVGHDWSNLAAAAAMYIVNATLWICLTLSFPSCAHKCVLHIYICIPALQIGSSVPFF